MSHSYTNGDTITNGNTVSAKETWQMRPSKSWSTFFVALAAAFFSIGAGPLAAADLQHTEALIVPEFNVVEKPLFECLWLLADETRKATENAPVFLLEAMEPPFEFIPERSGLRLKVEVGRNSFYKDLSFAGKNVPLDEILDGLMAADPRFVWEYDTQSNVVNVVEERLRSDSSWPLSQEISGVTLSPGEGIEALLRISRERGIRYSGPGAKDSKWRAAGTVPNREIVPATVFRSVVNRVLSHTVRDHHPFFMITYPVPAEYALNATSPQPPEVLLTGPFEDGFEYLRRSGQANQ